MFWKTGFSCHFQLLIYICHVLNSFIWKSYLYFWWLTGKGTPLTGTIYENPYEGDNPIVEIEYVALQVILKVDPYNGAPETYIIKTFYADNYTWTEQYIR